MFSPVASDVGSLSGCSAVLSLGLNALRAPERITLRSSVHLAAVNKSSHARLLASDRLPFALFGRF